MLDIACGIPSHLGNPSTDHHKTPAYNAIGNGDKTTDSKEALGKAHTQRSNLCS
jgi:hypothetical protein